MNVLGRRMQVALLTGTLLLVAGACGGSGSGISSAAGAQLQLRVAAIRASAARGDRSGAESQLASLRVDVAQFRARDKLDVSAATRILHAADLVETKLSLLTPPTTTTTTTTTEPPPTPPDKGKGHGKGSDPHSDRGD